MSSDLAVGCAPDGRSLLHAYCACLDFNNTCDAIARCLGEPAEVRLALRRHLIRMLEAGPTQIEYERLARCMVETRDIAEHQRGLVNTVDALHSAVFAWLPLPHQHEILERWIDRGTRGAMVRWLKATRDTPELFDMEIAYSYWKNTRDTRAAVSLVKQAVPTFFPPIIMELVQDCELGWVVAKAFIRGCCDGEDVWEAIKFHHPATYLYLCVKRSRLISDEEAYEVALSCDGFPLDGGRGLAIWPIGQMKKAEVLDRIRSAAPELRARDMARHLANCGYNADDSNPSLTSPSPRHNTPALPRG